jgi:glucans biosynthesis protein C
MPDQFRLFFIDYLRLTTTFAVIMFHAGRHFDAFDSYVKLSLNDPVISIINAFLILWIMPLFFILAGLSAFYSLQGRTGIGFLMERARRLLIPFLFVGFIISLPQVYIERVAHEHFYGSILDFLPHYFEGLYGFGGNFAWMGLHLWFLPLLFLFSILLLVSREATNITLFRIVSFPDFALILIPLPMILLDLIVSPDNLGTRIFGGHSVLVYFYLFVIGYLFLAVPNSLERIGHRWIEISVVALLSTICFLFIDSIDVKLRYVPWVTFNSLATFFLAAAFISIGQKILKFDHPLRKYGNESMMSVYILHQPIIVIAAFLLFWPLTMPPTLVYISLVIIGLSLSLLLHFGLIRKIPVLQLMFGSKGQPKGH